MSLSLCSVINAVHAALSRKRGPIYGAGFIAVNSEEQLNIFLSIVPAKYPFLEGMKAPFKT